MSIWQYMTTILILFLWYMGVNLFPLPRISLKKLPYYFEHVAYLGKIGDITNTYLATFKRILALISLHTSRINDCKRADFCRHDPVNFFLLLLKLAYKISTKYVSVYNSLLIVIHMLPSYRHPWGRRDRNFETRWLNYEISIINHYGDICTLYIVTVIIPILVYLICAYNVEIKYIFLIYIKISVP